MSENYKTQLDQTPLLTDTEPFDYKFKRFDKIKSKLECKFYKHIKKITALGMVALFVGGAVTCEFLQNYNEAKLQNDEIENTETTPKNNNSKSTASDTAEKTGLEDLLNGPNRYPFGP
jgi:uncharacterized protein with von Willebrand factor type A (vWA) domain